MRPVSHAALHELDNRTGPHEPISIPRRRSLGCILDLLVRMDVLDITDDGVRDPPCARTFESLDERVPAADSIREWLDREVKTGFGAKFAGAFEEVGFDDRNDLLDMDAEAMQALDFFQASSSAWARA